MKSLAGWFRPLVIVAGKFVGLLAKIRVSYELPPSVVKQHRTPSDFVARFAGICSAPIKAVFSALRVIFILVQFVRYKIQQIAIIQLSYLPFIQFPTILFYLSFN